MDHKIILGGAQYLGLAKQRLKRLREAGLSYAYQEQTFSDARGWVRLVAGVGFIFLTGKESVRYQFFSTGSTLEQETLSGTAYLMSKGYAISANLKLAAKPLGSTVAAGDGWDLITPTEAMTEAFPVKNIWQIQGVPEHAHYNGNARIVSSFGAASPLIGLRALAGSGRNTLTLDAFDTSFDVPPTIGSTGQAPDADWYRRAATITVQSEEFGPRTFIVMADVGNTFHAYPVGQQNDANQSTNASYLDQRIKTTVPESAVQRVAPLPAWAAAASAVSRDLYEADPSYFAFTDPAVVRDYVRQVPQYRWVFNSTGTRVASVVFERLSGAFKGGPPVNLETECNGSNYDLQEALPGLIEYAVNINITGTNPGEFTFDLEVVTELRPSVDKRFIMAADYAFSIPLKANRDDLLILVGRMFTTSAARTDATHQALPLNHKAIVEVQNLTQASAVLRTFVTNSGNQLYISQGTSDTDVPVGSPRQRADSIIIAMDLRIMAFVVQHRYVETALFWSGATINAVYNELDTTQAQRVRTYAYDELVDEKIMETLPSTLDDSLLFYIDDTDVTGLFEWDVTETGLYAFNGDLKPAVKNMEARRMFWGFFPNDYDDIYTASSADGGFNFDYGAFLYCTRMAPVLQLEPWDAFAVHPSGSWSICTRPIFYHAGPMGAYATPSPNPAAIGAVNFDLDLMRQATVDIVNFRNSRQEDIRTTHLDLFNTAYGLGAVEADFQYQFTKVGERFPAFGTTDRINTYLRALTLTGASNVFLIESRLYNYVSGVTTNQPNDVIFKPYQFDARTPGVGRYYTDGISTQPAAPGDAMPVSGPFTADFRYHPATVAILGGSSMFY